MDADGRTTSQQLYIPTLLVIGAGPALVTRCTYAADTLGLSVKTCTLDEIAIAVPRRHPLAMVVPIGVLHRAQAELEALARDVRSVLFPVDPEVSVRELEAMFAAAIAGTVSQRERRGGAGRYSITDGVAEEAPFSRSSAPPPPSGAPRSIRLARTTVPPAARKVV